MGEAWFVELVVVCGREARRRAVWCFRQVGFGEGEVGEEGEVKMWRVGRGEGVGERRGRGLGG